MKSIKFKKAFTLIELLVVVLIIAILAAIAIPKYQVLVEKTRAVLALTRLKATNDALDRYYLIHGSYPSTAAKWSVLDIEFPGCNRDGNYCFEDIWNWYIYPNTGNTLANRNPSSTKYYILYHRSSNIFSCTVVQGKENSDFYEKVCSSLCGTPTTSTCTII